jgi:6-phosphofructo-2-kinase
LEKFYAERFAEPSVRMPDSAGPSTPVGMPHYTHRSNLDFIPPEKSFSVWTSMMNRTRETAEYFDENTYAVKAMRMLDEIVLPQLSFVI